MKKHLKTVPAPQKLPDESMNGNLTALPKDELSADQASADPDLVATPMDYGDMNLKDAKESGYVTKNQRGSETLH